ncbi:MAG: single-stranded DNA-binding protein [Patescibacteria group bacterium]|jgi:single-strand DNA-binding protein
MASSLNKAMLIGNLTRDPEMRKTTGGQSVTSFSMATNRSYTDKAGNKKEEADFHNVVAWGRLAEICAQYLTKGKKVYVDGRIQTRDWEGQDGVKKYRTEIVIENMIMLGGPAGARGPSTSTPSPEYVASPNFEETPIAASEPSQTPDDEIKLEDIPF